MHTERPGEEVARRLPSSSQREWPQKTSNLDLGFVASRTAKK